MSERRIASSMVAPHRRNAGAFVVLYLGLLALLLVEQFVVHVPPIGYIDVALLFVVVNVLLGLERARAALRTHGTLRSAVLGVLPVAGLSTVIGALIVVASGSEPTVLATVVGGLGFLVLFLCATAGIQYASQRRRDRSGES